MSFGVKIIKNGESKTKELLDKNEVLSLVGKGEKGLELVGVAQLRKTTSFFDNAGTNTKHLAINWSEWSILNDVGHMATPTSDTEPEVIQGNNHSFVLNDDFDYIEVEVNLRVQKWYNCWVDLRQGANLSSPIRGLSIRGWLESPHATSNGWTGGFQGVFFNGKKGDYLTVLGWTDSGLIGDEYQGNTCLIKCYKLRKLKNE